MQLHVPNYVIISDSIKMFFGVSFQIWIGCIYIHLVNPVYYTHTVMMSAEDIWRVNTLHDVISDFCVIYDTQLCQHLMD